jgi:hypothetical protein
VVEGPHPLVYCLFFLGHGCLAGKVWNAVYLSHSVLKLEIVLEIISQSSWWQVVGTQLSVSRQRRDLLAPKIEKFNIRHDIFMFSKKCHCHSAHLYK